MTGNARPRVRKRFRPTLWASLATAVGLAILIALGSWQIQRKGEKEALIALLEARMEAPATPLPRNLDPLSDVVFLRVRTEGFFLHDKEVRLANRLFEKQMGFHVITPLRLMDGRTLLVDRGWVPVDTQRSAPGVSDWPEGNLTIEGILRQGGFGGPSFLQPENSPAEGLYLWPDLETMVAAGRLERPITTLYLVQVGDASSGTYPIARGLAVDLPNDHLQYALTWFALAAALLVIYVLYHYRPESEAR